MTPANPYLPLHATVVEAASWKLATDLVRRHPELTVMRYHPAGGTYDCLAIRSSNGLHIDLNRRGRIHVHAIEGGTGHPNWEPAEWTSYLAADPRDFVSHLERVVRLGPVAQIPPSTPKILVYRLLTAIARLQVLAETAEISMSTIDSSGYGAGPASWLPIRLFVGPWRPARSSGSGTRMRPASSSLSR